MNRKKSSNMISKYVKENTLKEKAKLFLLEKYKNGMFYSIPSELLDLDNSEDQRFLLELKGYFENARTVCFTIPENLYRDPEERENLIKIIKEYNEKDDKYISLNGFDYSHFSEDEKRELDSIKEHNDDKIKRVKIKCEFDIVQLKQLRFSKKKRKSSVNIRRRVEDRILKKFKTSDILDINGHIEDVENVNKEIKELELSGKKSVGQLVRIAFQKFGYKKEFLEIERNFDDYLFFEIQDFLKHKFSQFDEFDISKVGTSSATTMKFESQRELLLSIIKNLEITGVFNDLIEQENVNVELFETYMNNDKERFVPFNRASKDGVINYIKELDLETPQGVTELNVYLMHFISKLAAAHKEFAISGMKRNSISEFDYKINKTEKISEVENYYTKIYCRYLDDPNEENYEYAKRQFERFMGKNKASQFLVNIPKYSKEKVAIKIKKCLRDEKIPSIRKFESLDSYQENLYNKLKDLYREYNDCVNFERKNDMSVETFSKVFNRVIDSYYEEIGKFKGINSGLKINKRLLCTREKENLYKRIQQEDVDGDNVLVSVRRKNGKSFVETIIEEIERLERDGVLENIKVSLKNVVSQIELNDKLYQVKDYYRNSIINAYRLFPEIISVRNDIGTKDSKYPHVDIMVPGKLHFFRTRYNPNNEEDRFVIGGLPQIVDSVSDRFMKPGSSFLITYVPTDNFSNEQILRMEEVFYTIKYIDGLSSDALENDRYQKKGLFNVEKLVELKKTNPNFYEMLKLKTSLHKQAEFRRENTATPKMPSKLDEEKMAVAETISRLQEVNSWSDRDLFTKFIKIKDNEIIRYCMQRAQCKRFEKELALNNIQLPVNITFFHDQKSDDYFVEEMLSDERCMNALSYVERVRESMRFMNVLPKDKSSDEKQDDKSL